jgi:hypothetical protein
MADNDDQLLENARKAAQKVDIRYKAANLDGKVMLKSSRDKLFSAYAAARIDLLEDGVIANDEDVQKMKELQAEIDQAATNQLLAEAALKAARFLVKFV